jgi:branched-chain amino acid aminotransferase
MIGTGQRGVITEKLQTLYFDYVHGRKDDHNEWLSYVS